MRSPLERKNASMKQELRALRELQSIDIELAAARKALAALDFGAALKQGLAQTETILTNRSTKLQKCEAELKDNELKLKTLETKKKDLEKRLYGGKVTNPKELQGIQQEIEMIGRNRGKIDERILELYDIVEQQRASVEEAKERQGQFKTKLEHVSAQHKSKSDVLNADIARLTTARESAAKGVPPALLKQYEHIRSHSGGIGLAVVANGQCGGCHTVVTSFQQRQLKEDSDYHLCESCGRFLCLDD